MSQSFSAAYRRNVTVAAAASAMLYSEEVSGGDELAQRVQIAADNIAHDINMLRQVIQDENEFDLTADDALQELLNQAERRMSANGELLPDEAFLQIVTEHQAPMYPTIEACRNRVESVSAAFQIIRSDEFWHRMATTI